MMTNLPDDSISRFLPEKIIGCFQKPRQKKQFVATDRYKLTARSFDADLPILGHPETSGSQMPHAVVAHPCCHGFAGRAANRVIVDDDHFQISERLSQGSLQGFRKPLTAVAGRNDDGEFRVQSIGSITTAVVPDLPTRLRVSGSDRSVLDSPTLPRCPAGIP